MAAELYDLSVEVSEIRKDILDAFKTVPAEEQKQQTVAAPKPPPVPITQVEAPRINKPKPTPIPAPAPTPVAAAAPTKPVQPTKPKKTLLERFPGLEMFVGGKLITFIGILLLVTGIGFFVSYAIEHEWINEVGRTGIGLLAGGALIGTAHFLRKNFRAFSSVLIGGGIATLYFTIGYAYHEYKLFSQLTAFFLMVTVTSFGVLMSAAYNRVELAILSLIGGFMTPIALKGEANNWIALFSYLLILNSGMAVLAYLRNWKAVHVLSFIFTSILFGGWVFIEAISGTLPKTGAMIFATAFFVVFFAMNIAYNLKHKIKFKWLEYTLVLANSFFFFFIGLFIVENYKGGAYSGLFTAAVAGFHFVFAFLLYKRKSLDKNVIFILIGLVLTFITLAAPIQLDGNHITLFWAAEAVMLLWFGQRSDIKVIKGSSFVVIMCMLTSLIGQWGNAWHLIGYQMHAPEYSEPATLIFNRDFVASIFAIASVILTGHLLSREPDGEKMSLFGIEWFKWSHLKKVFPFVIVLVTYLGCYFEIKSQVLLRSGLADVSVIAVGIFNLLFAIGLHADMMLRKTNGFGLATFVISLVMMIVTVVPIHASIIDARNSIAIGDWTITYPFALHYLVSALTLGLVWLTYKQVQVTKWLKALRKPFAWVAAAMLVFVFSSELDHFMVYNWATDWVGVQSVLHNSQKAGYPIIWGIIAFAFIYGGIKMRNAHARIAGLSILGITLFKIFAIDVWEMTQLGRIVSFVSLGILVLVISFTYQKLTKLLFNSDQEKDVESVSK